VASLTGLFKTTEQEPEQDADKLVDLFRNRAELKKEFAALRDEKYQLQDRVKEHRGSIARVQQKLNHLESLLLDPEWVHNVVVFYQFRRLAAHCEARLQRFAEQLKQQREKRIYDKVMAEWNEAREQDAGSIEPKVGDVRVRLQLLEDRLQAERDKLKSMGGISKMLRGKSQPDSVDEIEVAITEAQTEERDLLLELERIENLEPPPSTGLGTGAKRSINFMILSYAQQLYLHYNDDDLAGLAKEASDKSVGAVNYGSKTDCDEQLERLARAKDEAEQATDSTEILQQRAKLIAKHALFRNDDDAVPAPGTVATVFDISANGVIAQIDANLLGENFFGVAKVLSR